MNLKDRISSSVINKLLATNSLAEEVEFDGQTITALVDRVRAEGPDMPGVSSVGIEMYVKAEDVSDLAVGKRVSLDGSYHRIVLLHPFGNLLKIELSRPES